MDLILFLVSALIVAVVIWITINKPALKKGVGFTFHSSVFRFSVYQSYLQNPNDLKLILEGDRIDELGYLIYKEHTADLDQTGILIRNNQTGEITKIVKNGDSESMIGVNHPEKGHIGYLQFVVVEK